MSNKRREALVEFPIPCYYCKKEIMSNHEHVYKKIPMQKMVIEKERVVDVNGIVTIKKHKVRKWVDVERDLHTHCAPLIVENQKEEVVLKEISDFDTKCWRILTDWLGYEFQMSKSIQKSKLESYAYNRLRAIMFNRSSIKGINNLGTKKVYDDEVLRRTMLSVTPIIKESFRTRKFNDEKHKVNFAMTVIQNHIFSMSEYIKKQERAEKQLDNFIEKNKKSSFNADEVNYDNFKRPDNFKPVSLEKTIFDEEYSLDKEFFG
ncbi:hypothetical protein JXA27_06705 [Aerococcaceae bacterium zg-B36]|uniref:hypothetical protein n=1 Tax=Aerococcaceae bacterium zg-252 TaxID=2796928 RepID=UPI001BD89C52|nr:hypothetical protein [Aerococcaceae bacterium zg-B36]